MKKITLLTISLLFSVVLFGQDTYKGSASKISFYSKTPLEDIEATNDKSVVAFLKTSNNNLVFETVIKGFKFDKPLMEEHFNENYMESDKYKTAKFVGVIQEKIDYTKDGENAVTAKGKMTIHGVTKDVEVKGKLTVKGGKITIDASFQVKLVDYKIKVPSLSVKNIAEVIDVTLNSVMEPFTKK